MYENFKEAIKNDVVKFVFVKKDGSLRYAAGTTNLNDVPVDMHPTGTMSYNNDLVQRYYDLNSNGWRSFILENLLWSDVDGSTYRTLTDDERVEIYKLVPNF